MKIAHPHNLSVGEIRGRILTAASRPLSKIEAALRNARLCRFGRLLRLSLLLVSPLLLMPLLASPASAYTVLAIKSANIAPYNESLSGFKASCGCTVTQSETDLTTGDLAAEVRRTNPDVVLAVGLDAFRHAAPIKDRPVVYTMISGPPSLPPDSSRISGVSMYLSPAKYLSAMREVFPEAKRIGLLYDPQNMSSFVREARQAAQSKGLELIAEKVTNPGSAPVLLDKMKNRIDLFWMIPDSTIVNSETVNYLLIFSFQNKVPIFTFSRKYVEIGAAAGLTISPADMGAQAADIAGKLLADKGQTPIRQDAQKTVISINTKIASKLGLHIKADVMRRADHVD